MDREIKKAEFVPMICTAAYLRRVNGDEEPGIGLGIAWEGNLFAIIFITLVPVTPNSSR